MKNIRVWNFSDWRINYPIIERLNKFILLLKKKHWKYDSNQTERSTSNISNQRSSTHRMSSFLICSTEFPEPTQWPTASSMKSKECTTDINLRASSILEQDSPQDQPPFGSSSETVGLSTASSRPEKCGN
jgi:hypothetical protein